MILLRLRTGAALAGLSLGIAGCAQGPTFASLTDDPACNMLCVLIRSLGLDDAEAAAEAPRKASPKPARKKMAALAPSPASATWAATAPLPPAAPDRPEPEPMPTREALHHPAPLRQPVSNVVPDPAIAPLPSAIDQAQPPLHAWTVLPGSAPIEPVTNRFVDPGLPEP